jgi:2,3-bisphosphoglycerate-independent phosphoglycerate mutase
MTAHKVVLLVLDGVSDRPCTELGGRTPLQAAKTPTLDAIASGGICGIMDTISPGIRPGSDTAHLSLLGYPPKEFYTGRGPLEAEGSGIHMEPGMIGFRCNFATIDRAGMIVDRRAGRIHRTEPLSTSIQEGVDLSRHGVEFVFCSGAGHRAALALKGKGLGFCVSSNDPKKDGVAPIPFCALKATPDDTKTAVILNDFERQSGEILSDHPLNRERIRSGMPPANMVLIRGAGRMGSFQPFPERYGMRGSVIAAATLITGIGKVVGLECIPVAGATGSADTNLAGKVEAALGALEDREFVLLNIKGADEAGHDGKAVEKRDFIERIDETLTPLAELEDCLLVVCSDHSTPCAIRDHSADPVPIMIHGEGVRIDSVVNFDEISCAHGGLHRICGESLMPIIIDLVDRAHKYGA